MKVCPVCQQEFNTGAGLASHHRAKHARRKGPNRKAVDAFIKELAEEPDVATVQMARSIADSLDLDPTNAQMWRQYREVLKEMKGDVDAGEETEDEVENIRGRAQVGHLKAL